MKTKDINTPPADRYRRAQVDRTGDFVRKTWAHRTADLAVQHSHCLLAGDLPDVFRVLARRGDVMTISSRHRTLRAAVKACEAIACEP